MDRAYTIRIFIMLVLSRRPSESLIINGNIKIIYLGQNNYGQAKLGIEAPKEVTVNRNEIHERILRERLSRECK